MHSSQDIPRRSSRRPRPELNINTSYSSTRGNSSHGRDAVPQTPPSSRNKPPVSSKVRTTASSRALRNLTHSAREGPDIDSFLDSITPADPSNRENDRLDRLDHPRLDRLDQSRLDQPRIDQPRHHRPRDSHDLSFSPRQVTRDSLVTNMLLSLDQFSMAQLPASDPSSRSPFDEPPSSSYSPFAAPPEDISRSMTFSSRSARNYGHGYSYSSDLEGADDASRISSGQQSRGRRSNSSSGFQSSLGRINSMRESSRQRSIPGTPRPLHSRGGKGSKGSSTNSIADPGYAQVLGSQRWAHGIGGRSCSFDHAQPKPSPTLTPQSSSPWHVELTNSFLSDEHDAAPTPTIPGGPRRLATVPSLPILPPPSPGPPRSPGPGGGPGPDLERRRSAKSSRSATAGRNKPDLKQPPPHLDTRDILPLPTFDIDSAPAPHVGYEKAKEAMAPAPPPPGTPQPPKEKPGFFRRMFGSASSKSNNNPNSPLPPSSSSPYMSSTSFESSSAKPQGQGQSQGYAQGQGGQGQGQTKSTSAPPSRDSHHSTTHVLQKKTSAFFRRRKQSVNDPDPPPPLPQAPVVLQPDLLSLQPPEPSPSKAPEPSPITSLRRAMDPFLKGSTPSTPGVATPGLLSPAARQPSVPSPVSDGQQPDSRDRNVRGFSPDYEPGPNAVIRRVDAEPSAYDFAHHDPSAADGDRASRRERRGHEPLSASRTGSFLSDNSDSETSPHQRHRGSSRYPADTGSRERQRPSSQLGSKRGLYSSASRSRSPAVEPRDTGLPTSETYPQASRSSRGRGDVNNNNNNSLFLPLEGAKTDSRNGGKAGNSLSAPTATPRRSTGSLRSAKAIDSAEISPKMRPDTSRPDTPPRSFDEPDFIVGDPTEDDRLKALKIYDGNEDFIQKEKAAAWMGEEGPVRQRTLRAYMGLYDFSGQNIATSLRRVCARLVLRAETQQVDRILVAFSARWCECNPNHGFKAADIIHTICYSIMLLNTDLHMADIEHKMTRSQFVKNTMTTIKQCLEEYAPEAFDRPSILPPAGGRQNLAVDNGDDRLPTDRDRRNSSRASFKPPPRPDSSLGASPDGSNPLVNTPFDGPLRAWEAQVELVLKDTYASIRDERLPLFGADPNSQLPTPGGLSVMGMLKRSPSVLSKTPSEGMASARGRMPEGVRAGNSRFSKSRSRHRPFGGTGFSSSRTSFDDGNSMWSPTESSATWSRYSLGRTHTSMSVDSFNSGYPRGDFQQSIGFANALSQAIIREDHNPAASSSALSSSAPGSALSEDAKQPALAGAPAQLLDDESLELAGPPWVKEGIVTHKHHLDGIDKKAKDRNWTEVFVVVQKGQIALFSFAPAKSVRNKSRPRAHGGPGKITVVGGGNWQENATNLGTFSLRQALASALPPPGYSRQRPHVWALSLPTGAVHLFQVGTPEISQEFINTANYWSARLSTHPLVGGISNMEYGWSDAIANNSLVSAINESPANLGGRRPSTGGVSSSAKGHSRPGSATNAASVGMAIRSSLQSRGSMRSGSFDFGRPGSGGSATLSGGIGGGVTAASASSTPGSGSASRRAAANSKLPGDRAHIADWSPPTQSMRPSNLPEGEQLETLMAYVRGIEEELQKHNSLRSPMLLAFTPRSANHGKAMANWQRKSEYLLREIVKFRTYVDCLQAAETRKAEIQHEREAARRAARGEDVGSIGSDEEDPDATLRP